MAELTLRNGEIALVDDEDYDRISGRRWYLHKGGKGAVYVAAREMRDGVRSFSYLQREIMGEDAVRIGFRNGNTLDCRKENLEVLGRHRPVRTIDKGAEAEALVCADLIRQGHDVYLPFSGHCAVDLVSVRGEDRPVRWQVKCRKAVGDGRSISLALRANRGGSPIDLSRIDAFAIYSPEMKSVFYVPLWAIPKGAKVFNLNIGEGRKGWRRASDFCSPDSVWAQSRAQRDA